MVPTSIAGEHPLTLYLDKREIVTLMTLGHAPEALAIGYLRNQRLVDVDRRHRRGAGRLGDRLGRRHHAFEKAAAGARQEDRDHRLRPGHGVRRPDGGDRPDQAAQRRVPRGQRSVRAAREGAQARDHLQAGRRGARLRARHHRGRDPDVRRGRRPPQRGRRDRRLHVARRDRRLGQGVLHHRPAHLRDGDQVRADAHPVPGLALGAHPDGPPDREARSA